MARSKKRGAVRTGIFLALALVIMVAGAYFLDKGITGYGIFEESNLSNNLEIKDAQGNLVEAEINVLTQATVPEQQPARFGITEAVPESRYDVEIKPRKRIIKKVVFKDLLIGQERLELKIDENKNETRTYAIDPTQLDFTQATIFVTASENSTSLFKCTSWNFTSQECDNLGCSDEDEEAGLCNQTARWIKIMDLIPGQEYNFTINATDPGFYEGGESVGESSTVSETYVNKVSKTFTPEHAGYYLILASAEARTDTTSYLVSVRTTLDGTATSESIWEPKDADSYDDYQTFFTHQVAYLDTNSHTVNIDYLLTQYDCHAYIRNARVTIIDLSEYNYTTIDAEQSLGSAYADAAVLTFTPTAADNYLILATGEYKAGSTEKTVFSTLEIDGAVKNEARYEGKEAYDYKTFAFHNVSYLNVGVHTIKVKGKGEYAGYGKMRRVRIVAIRMTGDFDYHSVESNGESSTSSSSLQDKTILTFTPNETANYLVLATAEIGGSSIDYSATAQLEIDGTTYADMRFEPHETSSPRDYTSFATTQNVTLANAPHTFKIKYKSECDCYGCATAYIRNARITVFKITPVPGDTTSPNITLIRPPNASYDSNGEVWFRFNVTDDSIITSCKLIINQTINATMLNVAKDTEQTFNVTGLDEGTISWSVNCTDSLGNRGSSESWMLIIDFPEGAPNTTLIIDETIEDAEGNFINATIELIDLGSGETDVETSSGVMKNISAGDYNIKVTPADSNVQNIILTNLSVITDIYEVIDLDFFETTEYDFIDGFAINTKIENYTSIIITKTAVTGDPFICENWNFTTATCIDGRWRKIGNYEPGENYTLTIIGDTTFGIIESNYTINLLTQDLYFIPNSQITVNEVGTIVDVLVEPYPDTLVYTEGRVINITVLSHDIINISNDLIVQPFSSVAFPNYILFDPTPLNFINATITRIAGPTSASLWKCPVYNFTEDICQVDLIYLIDIMPNEVYSYTLPADDPVFIEQPNDLVGVDSFIDKNTANTNYGVSAEMRVDDRSANTKRSMIQWNVSAIPPKANITSAVMEAYMLEGWGANISTDVVRITSVWNESTVTWNNQPGYDAAIYANTVVPDNTSGFYAWNITNLFKLWHNGTYSNYGLYLKADDETAGSLNAKRFYTSDYSNASLRPRLTVSYPDLPPTSNSPPDWVVDLGQLSTINWILVDDIFPGYYFVQRNGSSFTSPAPWIDNATTLVYPNNYFLGTWNYTIFFNDSAGNNGTQDTVLVTVLDNSTPNCNESSFNPNAPTLASIVINGNVSDWDAVLANPKNYMADLTEAAGDLDDVQTADRDLVGFAYTWDSQKLYFYFKRLTTGNREVSMIAYIDYNLDGYMNASDKVVKFVWQGTTRYYDSVLYNYVPAGTADLMNGSGYDMPGSITVNKSLETNIYGGTDPGIILETRVNWTDLYLSSPRPLNFQAAVARGSGTNLPSQLEDNAGTVNSKYANFLFKPNRYKAAVNGTSVYYDHDLMNCGNLAEIVDLTNLSSQGWQVTLYYPNGTLITDSNSNGLPDVRLGVTNYTTIIVKIDVPGTATIGTVDVTNITAQSFVENSYTKSVTDTTSIGQIAITPNQRIISGAPGMTATLNYTVYSYQGVIDTIEIGTTSNQGWSTAILYLNGSAISDTDSDGYMDLGSFLPGQSKDILLRFLIPVNATYGTVDLTTIRINSSVNPTLTTTATASTTVKPRITLEPDYNRSVGIGDSTYYYLTIGHNWNASDTIDLTYTYLRNYLTEFFKIDQVTYLTDTDSDSKVDTGIIGPYGSEYSFYAKVTVPSNASEGNSERTVVYANSSLNTSRYDLATLNTTARILITYLDAGRATEETIFEIGEIVYARAHSLVGINNAYFEWIDSNATVIRISPDIPVSSESKADDQLNSNLSMLLGEWTVVVFNAQNDAEVGRAIFYLVDTVPPNVTLNYPPNNFYNNSNPFSVTFNCSASDNYGLTNLSLYLTNNTNQSFSLNQTTNVSGYSASASWTLLLPEGIYTWNCLAYDLGGNSAWGINRTIKDSLAPKVKIITPAPGTNYNQTNIVNITVNVTDFHTDTVLANVSWDSTSQMIVLLDGNNDSIYEGLFNNTFFVVTSPTRYNITAIANDTYGNVNNTEKTYFNVNDVTPPRVTNLKPINGTNYNQNSTVIVSAEVNDPYWANVDKVYANVSWDNTSQILHLVYNLTQNAYVGLFTNTSLVGEYNVTFWANDTSNNINNTEKTTFSITALPVAITAAGYKCTVTATPNVAEAGEQVLLQADIAYNDGTPATTLNITSANVSISRIIGSGITFVSGSSLNYITPGIWYAEFNTSSQAYGNYMAIVNAIVNSDPSKLLSCSEVFTLFGRGNFEITGISPDLINVNETTRLAAEVKFNGEPVAANLITAANLAVMKLNGTTQTFTPVIDNGIIYVDGAFNETGVYYLDWSATYYNLNKSAREIAVLVDWGEKLDNLNISINLNATELVQLIKENRQYLLELLVNMEYMQRFTEEEVFLITDSVNSMTEIVNYLENGDLTDAEAQKQFEVIRQELISKLGDKLTGSAISELEKTTQTSLWAKMTGDWRTVMFILLLLIFGILVGVAVLLVKVLQTKVTTEPVLIRPIQNEIGPAQKMRPVFIPGLTVLEEKEKKEAASQPKRRYQVLFDKIKEKIRARRQLK